MAPFRRAQRQTDDGGEGAPNRRAVTVRVPAGMLTRIDTAAKRLGLSRAALMLAATAERVEAMEGKRP
jgi:hypothetical protein